MFTGAQIAEDRRIATKRSPIADNFYYIIFQKSKNLKICAIKTVATKATLLANMVTGPGEPGINDYVSCDIFLTVSNTLRNCTWSVYEQYFLLLV